MICRRCQAEGKESRVTCRGSIKTLMGHQPYYDEAGLYHNHDPNKIKTGYTCSNGHTWSNDWYAPCPSCAYKRHEDEYVEY